MFKTIWYLSRCRARESFSSHLPRMFILAERLKNGRRARSITEDAELVVEGFPRSANSFTVHAFLAAQSRYVETAHHLHLPLNVIYGVKRGKPTLVLMRNPVEAAVSNVALQAQARRRERADGAYFSQLEFELRLKHSLHAWMRYYRSISPFRHGFLWVAYEDVVRDLGSVIDALNRRFGTDFDVFRHTRENVLSVFSRGGYHLNPSAERDAIKDELFELVRSPRLAKTAQVAISHYEDWRRESDRIFDAGGRSVIG